jgi:hypothetical protein
MKKLLLLVLTIPACLLPLVTANSASAQMNCTLKTVYKTERWWSGSVWRTSSMPYVERECTPTFNVTPNTVAPPQLPSLPENVPFDLSSAFLVTVSTDTESLNVRSAPEIGAQVLHSLPNGSLGLLSGEQSKGWVQLLGGGWVHSKYLKPFGR